MKSSCCTTKYGGYGYPAVAVFSMDPLEEYCCKTEGFAAFFSAIRGAAHVAGAIFIQFTVVQTFKSSQNSRFENFLFLQELFRFSIFYL